LIRKGFGIRSKAFFVFSRGWWNGGQNRINGGGKILFNAGQKLVNLRRKNGLAR
jgi:hypothetical protein